MGVVKSIRIGHDLQVDVHVVKDGSETRFLSIIGHNLDQRKDPLLFSVS